MEYYIYNVPVMPITTAPPQLDIAEFCTEVEGLMPQRLLSNVEVVYIGEAQGLTNRAAAFSNGAIYLNDKEPTIYDMVENFIHEVAHSLEAANGWDIYDESFKEEFLGKRRRLRSILSAEGYNINPKLYEFTEYNETFDNFLANKVGYPLLLSLTMGLFASPYGATSIQEYFANGFERYFLDSPQEIKKISPVLYQKVENTVHG